MFFYDLGCKLFPFSLQAHLNSRPEKEKISQERLVEPLMSLVKSYERGREGHARIIVRGLFEDYLSIEELFNDNIQVSVIHEKQKNCYITVNFAFSLPSEPPYLGMLLKYLLLFRLM